MVRRQLDVNIVLKSEPTTREESDIAFLVTFLKTLPMFTVAAGEEEYTQEMLEDIAGDITGVDVLQNEIVFLEGDPSDCCFIVLTGSLNIMKYVIKKDKFFDKSGRRRSVSGGSVNRRPSLASMVEQNVISTLKVGATFGQMGLLKNQPRGRKLVLSH
jgi:CRP-like cAMP-binding protein